jgi:hypothetical protein
MHTTMMDMDHRQAHTAQPQNLRLGISHHNRMRAIHRSNQAIKLLTSHLRQLARTCMRITSRTQPNSSSKRRTPHTPYGATRGAYGDSEANLGAPYANDTFAGDTRYAADDGRGRGREPPENVSAPVNDSHVSTTNPNNGEQEAQDAGTSVHPNAAHEPFSRRTSH